MDPMHLYLRLRQLEIELAKPGALENFRDTTFNALGFFQDVAYAIDRYEEVYPELKTRST